MNTIEKICASYGLRNENELYQYMVESYFNGQLRQAKNIFNDLKLINTLRYNYIADFRENLNEWFEPETATILKKFFGINI